jgi:hypothetical protein
MTNEKKRLPGKSVTEQLPFYPDLTAKEQEPFFCLYVDETVLGDKPDPKDNIPVFILADAETGEEVFCTQSYAIKKTIEAAKSDLKDLTNVVFYFQFLGKEMVKGKPFNKFNGRYMTLKEYDEWKKADSPSLKVKKEKD